MKSLKSIVLFICLAVTNLAYAEKLAIVDIQQAILTSDEAKAYEKKLKQELASDQSKVLELEKQAKSLRKKIQDQGSSLSKEDSQRLQLQFQKAFEEYQRTGRALQQRRAEREQEFLTQMRPKLDKVIRKIIEENDYDVVLARQATVFAKKEVDITAKVVQLLNAE